MISIPALILMIIVAMFVAIPAWAERRWDWMVMAIVMAFFAGLAIYFKILGAI